MVPEEIRRKRVAQVKTRHRKDTIVPENHALLPKAYIHFVTPRHRKETKLTL
jgi:hypothetical protein